MNSIVGDLSFTVETMTEFEDGCIPTLDFNMWLSTQEGTPRLHYKFYSKPMSSRYVVLETSAWAWTSKCVSLLQEVHRRLQNTSRDLPSQMELDTLADFQLKLKRSGYNREQVRQIMEVGIRGFHAKRRRGEVHRPVTTI